MKNNISSFRTITLIALFISLSCFPLLTFGQKAKEKKFKKDVLIYPTLPVENFQKIAFKFYYPDRNVTIDTIRRYMGNMKLLKGEGIRVGEPKYRSIRPVKMVNEDWDFLVEVAFLNQGVKKKEMSTKMETVVLKGKTEVYYYNINHQMPTIVKITNQAGEIIDMWEASPTNIMAFDGKNENTVESDGNETKMTFKGKYFLTEQSLKEAYKQRGEEKLSRMAFLMQMRKVLDALYPKIYFEKNKDKFNISSGKSRKFDYSELDQAQEDAITKIEENRIEELTHNIKIWEKYLAQHDASNKKAMINNRVAKGLQKNLSLAYLYQSNFEKAIQHAEAHDALKSPGGMTAMGLVKKRLSGTVQRRAKGYQANAALTIPEKMYKYLELKNEIGKRGKNTKYDLIFTENRFPQFYKEHEQFNYVPEDEPETQAEVGEEIPQGKYASQIIDPGTPEATLVISFMEHGDLIGKAMPEEITELENLYNLQTMRMKFTEIPESISRLTSLKTLNLSRSALKSLPESIGQLVNLEVLNLNHNQLTTLPESIKNCTKLKTVKLKGNAFSKEELEKIKSWLPKGCKVK